MTDALRRALLHWVFTPLAGVRLGDWLGVLRRHGGRIPWRYLPRTLFTTTMAAGNSLLAARERRRYGPALEGVRVRAPVFVLGHHRSGTTHLWNLLAVDPRFVYPTVLQAVFPHTFLTCESLLRGPAARVVPETRPQDNVRFGPDAPIEEERAICTTCFLSMQMVRHFPRDRRAFERFLTMRDATPVERERWKASLDRFARKLLVRRGGDATLLFKAPDHTGKIRLLLELYPDARFVHIHRHPFEVFASTLGMERRTQPLYAYQPLDETTLEDLVLWRYREMYDGFFEASGDVPEGRLVDVRFDRVRGDPLAAIEDVYGRLDLGSFDEVRPRLESYVASLAAYRMNVHPELPDETRRRIADAWRPSFEAWGYAT